MPYTCSVCQGGFTTSSHLKRHEAKHYGSRNFACSFCSRSFSRSDTLRRHEATCNQRGDRPLPPERKRGQTKRACDACALSKVACAGGQPCERCLSDQLECSYERLSAESNKVGGKTTLATNLQQDIPSSSFHTTFRPIRMDMPFLLKFTDARTRSLVERFDAASEEQQTETDHRDLFGIENFDFSLFLPPFFDSSVGYGPFDDIFMPEANDTFADLGHLDENTDADTTCLAARLDELMERLRTHMSSVSSHVKFSDCISENLEECILFEPAMADRLINAYFARWHRHAPIIHRATFNAATVSLPLLLSMIMMGAMFYAQHTAVIAGTWLDLTEDFVFECEEFSEVIKGDCSAASQASFETLQAAVILVIMQDWGHDLVSRRRMRLHRYVDVISAARCMGVFSIRHVHHNQHPASFDQFSWLVFVEIEQKIRTAAYIYLIDCAWTIFHGTLPRMTTQEMTGDSPCFEKVFEAETAQDCHQILSQHISLGGISLAKDTKAILEGSIAPSIQESSTMYMFMLIHAVHVAIFTSKATCTLHLTAKSLEHALNTWQELWNLHSRAISAEEFSKLGFYKSAPEYRRLGHILLKAYVSTHDSSQPVNLDTDSMDPLNDLLKRISDLEL